MGAEENKAAIRRFIVDAWSGGNVDVIDEVVHPDVIDHNPGPGQAGGLDGQKQVLRMFRAAFDMKITLDLLLSDGDYVIDRWTAQMKHKADFMGIPATGKAATITGMDISRFENGKVKELWHMEDQAGLLVQLGVIPMPGEAPVAT